MCGASLDLMIFQPGHKLPKKFMLLGLTCKEDRGRATRAFFIQAGCAVPLKALDVGICELQWIEKKGKTDQGCHAFPR